MSLNEIIGIDLDKLDFDDQKSIKVLIFHLFNLLEALHKENVGLKDENQKFKDEVNRLKGEKGKPKFKAKSAAPKYNSSKPKPKKKKGQKQTKVDKIEIDDEKVIKCSC